LRAVEHQMLEQVRESGLALRLVFRADVVPDADGHDRRLPILVNDDAQTVVQREPLVSQIQLRRAGGRAACPAGVRLRVDRRYGHERTEENRRGGADEKGRSNGLAHANDLLAPRWTLES